MTADAESPYLLPPGPARRRMMAGMGIRPCILDLDDDEWSRLRVSSDGAAGDDDTAERVDDVG